MRPLLSIFLRCAVVLAIAGCPAFARIIRTRSSGAAVRAPELPPGGLWQPFYSLVVGGGFEFAKQDGEREFGFPLLVEYDFSETFKLNIEPKYVRLSRHSDDGGSLSGWGDLELTLDYEFLSERRYRPALSIESRVKFPTAAHEDLGEPGRDYTLGLVASKDLVYLDLDLNVLHTFGGADRPDEVEASAAIAWHLNPRVDVIGEVTTVAPVLNVGDARRETEATLGLAWFAGKHLTLEGGVVFKEGGEAEAVLAWEWSFGGND